MEKIYCVTVFPRGMFKLKVIEFIVEKETNSLYKCKGHVFKKSEFG